MQFENCFLHESDFACITVQNAKEILRYLQFVRKYCDIVWKLLDLWSWTKFQIAVSPKVIRVESKKSFGNVSDQTIEVSAKLFKSQVA